MKVDEAEQAGKKVICSLMLDEMAIRKHISWDGNRFCGYVDVGNGIEDDTSPVAKEALVFMVVSFTNSWKVPCAYFLIDGLSGAERANFITVCIQRLSDIGVKVVSLTCDGPSCHFSMLSDLGASLSPTQMVPYFAHPSNNNEKVYVFLDVCHMLKLVRNTLAQSGIIVDSNNGRIQWQYLVNLQKLQEKEGLRLANKLTASHIQWYQQKMRVNLAAQALNSTIADALEYCANTLHLQQFQGCEATVKFIRQFDRLFDVLNSRNPFAKVFKSALRINNKSSWAPFLSNVYEYILGLKDTFGVKLYETRRKTGFIGFLVAIQSTEALFHDLVEIPEAPLSYILMYKCSQDHLELIFWCYSLCWWLQ